MTHMSKIGKIAASVLLGGYLACCSPMQDKRMPDNVFYHNTRDKQITFIDKYPFGNLDQVIEACHPKLRREAKIISPSDPEFGRYEKEFEKLYPDYVKHWRIKKI